jgi:hypothetical protein
LNREDREEKNVGLFAAEQSDRFMDREGVARHIVDSAVVIHPVHRAQLFTYLSPHKYFLCGLCGLCGLIYLDSAIQIGVTGKKRGY